MSSADEATSADRASSSPIMQAMASHGAMLGRHDELLRSLAESNHLLMNQVSLLTDQVSSLSAQLATATANPQAPSATALPATPNASVAPLPVAREPSAPTPERYDGNLGSCQSFLTQVSLVFELQPVSYATERSRIAYLIGLLKGPARDWGAAIWEKQNALCHSYAAFVNEMKKVFDHPVRGREAGSRLSHLRQGRLSVAEYTVGFRTLAAESGWNDAALQETFYRGLNEEVKDELATRDDTADLDALISLSIRLDNRIRERRRERSHRTSILAPPHLVPGPGTPVTSQPADSEAMQIGRARLTPQEREQRGAANSCFYCGASGHYLVTCPKRMAKELAPR